MIKIKIQFKIKLPKGISFEIYCPQNSIKLAPKLILTQTIRIILFNVVYQNKGKNSRR